MLRMAFRNLWRNKWRSWAIITSIALGIFSGLAVLSLYKGMLSGRINSLIKKETGHIQLHMPAFSEDRDPAQLIPDGNTVLDEIRKDNSVAVAAPRLLSNGMIQTTTGSQGILIFGIEPEAEIAASGLGTKLTEGTLFAGTMRHPVLIGKKLAAKLRIRTGSRIVLTVTDTSGTIVSGAFRVEGIYHSNNARLDEQIVYVPLPELSSLLQTGNNIHEICILLHQNGTENAVAERLRIRFPALKTETWKALSPETDLMIGTVDTYSFVIIAIIMIALSFGITNTMLMAVMERTKEIGMLIALGTVKPRIFMLIVYETLLLTALGLPAGILLSWPVISYFSTYGLDLSGMGKDLMANFGYETLIYPEFPSDKLTGILTIVFITTVLASVLPVIKAVKLQPAAALKK